ncbi:hypothetical protein [Bacillus taeanensis]|uniref:Uncharacterized protein n=1 Tax=Bacillus taeanensis TaxID=273032 RepID=A0A366XT17_9BACI|nr:hypothetical protein [Bacillus taeanensis]RBW68295.1 hypothetical protein DS031_17385 [Bacillus taeanensis]
MKQKLIILIIAILFSLTVLSACNVNHNNMIEPEDVNVELVRYDRNNDRDMEMRGNDLDTDPRNVGDEEDLDTLFNLDEEEPDLYEEPSEKRRGE